MNLNEKVDINIMNADYYQKNEKVDFNKLLMRKKKNFFSTPTL